MVRSSRTRSNESGDDVYASTARDPVFGDRHPHAEALQDPFGDGANGGLVVDDEDSRRRAPAAPAIVRCRNVHRR
jgi:hypothetical protein